MAINERIMTKSHCRYHNLNCYDASVHRQRDDFINAMEEYIYEL